MVRPVLNFTSHVVTNLQEQRMSGVALWHVAFVSLPQTQTVTQTHTRIRFLRITRTETRPQTRNRGRRSAPESRVPTCGRTLPKASASNSVRGRRDLG